MADDHQDKTEEATSKKLVDSRNKGQVAKSQDFTSAILLFAALIVLSIMGNSMFFQISIFMNLIFSNLHEPFADQESVVYWFKIGMYSLVIFLLPTLLAVYFAALFANIAQVGLVFSTKPLMPKWKNLNIFDVKTYKKFFDITAVMRLVFGLSKLSVVGIVVATVILGRLDALESLMLANPKEILEFLFSSAAIIGTLIALILIVLGVVDFAYQKWKFARDMKMTKQEVKDERKQSEGDPQVKSKIRSMMQSFSQSRMKENVPESDVVIANPTHFAVAVKYDAEGMSAPVCLAKGARKMALAIKEIAKENKVPIVENPLLARALYRSVEVGGIIPAEYYQAVAEVLAYVYRLNDAMGKGLNNPVEMRRQIAGENRENEAVQEMVDI